MEERRAFPKTAATALLVALGASLPYAVPGLERLRLVSSADLARATGSFRGVPRVRLVRRNDWKPPATTPAASAPAAAVPEARGGPAGQGRAVEARRGPPAPSPGTAIEDPSGELGHFFSALDRVERGEAGALARITHFGDSPLTGDLISGEARTILQSKFGNGGPGFVLAGRPWGWYGHQGTAISGNGWTMRSPLLTPGNGGHHGLGLVSFTSASASSFSEVVWEKGRFTRAEVTFTAGPGGGTLLVSLDGGPEEAVSTLGPERRTGRYVAAAPDGASRVTVRPKGDGDVTVYGVTLETAGPGVVYDAVGANGASFHALSVVNAKGLAEALAMRGSDLVILNYGTNESGIEGIAGPRYVRELTELVGRIRSALPDASVLVMSPMDRGARGPDGEVTTLGTIPKLVEAQRRAAREAGCAFFDTFTAMGGEGTMARWYDSEPRLVAGDFTHPSKQGSDRVARLLVDALLDARANGASRSPQAAP